MVTRSFAYRRARRSSGLESQAGGAQPAKQFPARGDLCSGNDQIVEVLLGDVVVVPLEPSARDPCPLGERMQLVIADIADEM